MILPIATSATATYRGTRVRRRRQPSGEILNPVGIGTAQAQPSFLNGVIHLAQGAKHPVGHRAQVTSVFFESPRQPFAFVHRSHSIVALHRVNDE
jgi:hypothetical protein